MLFEVLIVSLNLKLFLFLFIDFYIYLFRLRSIDNKNQYIYNDSLKSLIKRGFWSYRNTKLILNIMYEQTFAHTPFSKFNN